MMLPAMIALLTSSCVSILGLDDERELAPVNGSGGSGGAGVGGGSGGPTDGGAKKYAARVMADGPVAYYRFEEASGDFVNQVSAATPAKPSAGVTHGKSGAIGLAAEFDGKSGRAVVGDVFEFDGQKAMSIELWLQATSQDRFQHIVHKGIATPGAEASYGLSINSQNRLQFSRVDPINGFRHATKQPMVFNTLLHVVCTFDGTTSRLFVNGMEEPVNGTNGTAGQVSIPDTSFDFSIGAASSNFGFFAGTIDELAIYDKALPASAIQAHYALATSP